MKKLSTFLLILAIFLFAGSWNVVKADVPDGYYKKYHIVENFDGLEALPSGWSADGSATSYYRNGSATVADDVLTLSGSGGGTRGIDILFPTPQANETVGESDTWFVEFDYTINKAAVNAKNALGFLLMGSERTSMNNDGWYAPVIFGLYAMGDGYWHYWNQDPLGPIKSDIYPEMLEDPEILADPALLADANSPFGSVFTSGQYPAFGRAANDLETATAINESTKMDVVYANGKTYHIEIELNFATQKVVKLVVTDVDDNENTQTITDKEFLAPHQVGSTSAVPLEERIVNDLQSMSFGNTRSSNAGNGGNSDFNVSVDNLEIYRLETSLGQKDVAIHFVDREGAPVKESRIASDQEVGNPYKLIPADKEGFMDDTSYYVYDAVATHEANSAKGEDGESVVVSLDGDNSLTVVFKKSALAYGNYVWTGANGFRWDELSDNFSVNGGSDISYQNGNAVSFSSADVNNKEIQVTGKMDLGEGDLVISAPGYSFTAETESAVINGLGVTVVDAPTILGFDNRMEGGVLINTTEGVHIKHAKAATKYTVNVNDAVLKLEANADFNTPITTIENGTLNIECVSNNFYDIPITNASTINVLMSTAGSHNANWRSAWRTDVEEGTQVNVETSLGELPRLTGFGVGGDVLRNAKLHLGDYVRLLRHYNETNDQYDGSIMRIGELSGTEHAVIEGGFVDGRASTIEVGYLNTDAVFGGPIRQYFNTDTTQVSSKLRLVKVGTGSWTIEGELNFNGEIVIRPYGGTLVLNHDVPESVTTVSVDTLSTFVGKNIDIYNSIEVNIGTLQGDISATTFSLTGSTLKLNVNSFNDGDYDALYAYGDININDALDPEDLNVLDITVNSAEAGASIDLLIAESGLNGSFNKVLVNGEDITANEETTEGAKFVFTLDKEGGVGTLLSLVDFTGVNNVLADKAIESVQYFNIAGQLVDKNTRGVIIQKITYVDGSKATVKVFVPEI